MQLWWLTSRGARLWSIEERRARWAIYAVAVPIVAFLFFVMLFVGKFLRLGETAGILLSLAIASYPALFISRGLCVWVWPDLMRRADANAASRLGFRRV